MKFKDELKLAIKSLMIGIGYSMLFVTGFIAIILVISFIYWQMPIYDHSYLGEHFRVFILSTIIVAIIYNYTKRDK